MPCCCTARCIYYEQGPVQIDTIRKMRAFIRGGAWSCIVRQNYVSRASIPYWLRIVRRPCIVRKYVEFPLHCAGPCRNNSRGMAALEFASWWQGTTALGGTRPPPFRLRGSASVIAPQVRFSCPKPRLARGARGASRARRQASRQPTGGWAEEEGEEKGLDHGTSMI